MKNDTLTLFALFSLCLYMPSLAQVGINTTSPKSALDIQASNSSSPSNRDGILIPRVNSFPSENPGADQNGMMIFLTTAIGTSDKGFYYWDDPTDRWISIGSEEWKAGTNAGGDQLIYATRAKLTGTDMVITDDGRIGFGTSDPIERFEFKGPGDNDFQITSANTNPPNYILYNTGGTLENPTALATNGEIGSFIVKTHDSNGIVETGGFRFFMDGTASPGSAPSRFVINTTPVNSVNQVERIIVRSTGNVGLTVPDPTATLHIKAGTATAGSAPLKFNSGTNLTTPEAGTMEYNGTNLFFTPSSTRQIVMTGFANTTSLNFPVIAAYGSSELTVTVPGATLGSNSSSSPNGTIEQGLIWSSYVSAVNTVTIRLFNANGIAIDPAVKTWKTTVIP